MFVESHPSQDVTLEGSLKLHRPKPLIVADLALRAIGVKPSNPSEARAFRNFCGKQGYVSTQKVLRECTKIVVHLRIRQRK
jgi:hypothetical protein